MGFSNTDCIVAEKGVEIRSECQFLGVTMSLNFLVCFVNIVMKISLYYVYVESPDKLYWVGVKIFVPLAELPEIVQVELCLHLLISSG